MASILPKGVTQFCDANGVPYASGSIYFYVPNTLTFKDTYQDIGQLVLNPNPVVLDAAGRAVIWGNGAYRQRLFDSLGNLIWDQETTSVVSQAMEAVVGATTLSAAMTALGISVAMQPVVGASTLAAARTALGVFGPNGGIATGSPSVTINPIANPSIPTLATLGAQATTGSDTTREFLGVFGLTIQNGASATGGNQDKVALYAGANMVAGSGDGWAINSVTTIASDAPVTCNAQGYELDFNNLNAHRGDAAAGAGLASPVAYGFSVTGAGSFRSTAAFLISGPGTGIWNRGIVIANTSVVQASFQDLSNATTSLEVFGSHTYGFDAQDASFSAGPIRIGNSAFMLARNAANSADLRLIGLDNANNLNLGGSGLAATFVYCQFLPNTDNSFTLGGPSNRWSVVYAGTGAINTSDATEKIIRGAPNTAELAAWATVEPKVFTFLDGTRSHVGYVAQEVAAALTAQGLKPADYGFWCKDDWTDAQGVAHTRQGLRYEECAVMEAALTRQKIAALTARIAALEAK